MVGSYHINLSSGWRPVSPEVHIEQLIYPLANAVIQAWSDGSSLIFEQVYPGVNISVYSYEMHIYRPDEVRIDIFESRLKGLYLLEGPGELVFKTGHDLRKIELSSAQACYSYVPAGNYLATVDPGIHVLWGIVLHRSLIDKLNYKAYQHLYDLVYDLDHNCHSLLQSTPYFKIGERTKEHLHYLIQSLGSDPLVNEAILLKTIARLVALSKEKMFDQYQRVDPELVLATKARKIVEEMVETKGYVVKIQDIARLLKVSESHLRSVNRKIFNQPLQQYLTFRLIDRCKHHLTLYKHVDRAAYECGFDTPQVFSRYFKHYTGMTPVEYIRRSKR